MTFVSRDPFAREEIHKELVGQKPGGCDWCGADKKLYSYRLETDGGRTFEIKGNFCCKSCYNAYHGR